MGSSFPIEKKMGWMSAYRTLETSVLAVDAPSGQPHVGFLKKRKRNVVLDQGSLPVKIAEELDMLAEAKKTLIRGRKGGEK